MNSWLSVLEKQFPAALNISIQVTVLLSAGLIAQVMARRSSAARYAMLLWTMVAVGLCPFAFAAMRLAAIPTPAVIRNAPLPLQALLGIPQISSGLQSSGQIGATHQGLFSEIAFVLWVVGALLGLSRIFRGLFLTRQLERSARPISMEKISAVRQQLSPRFGPALPEIFISDRAAVPMAIGYLRPIILLPSSLLGRIDDQQLFQVLVHECAHARRRDALVALYQRLLLALFWFHPLVYFASRLLDRLREELCDNYVLQIAPARDYAHTLLVVAESLSPQPSRWFAPALIQSSKLESRIAGLLHSRRCMMTQLTSKEAAAIAVCFLGSVIALSCFAAVARQDSDDFSHIVNLQKTSTGDSITIQEVRGPSDTLAVGNTYEVRGTYKLASHDKAMLAVYVTTEGSKPHTSKPDLPSQKMIVEKGEGSFTLRFHMSHEGKPHASFYPEKGGNSFAATYF